MQDTSLAKGGKGKGEENLLNQLRYLYYLSAHLVSLCSAYLVPRRKPPHRPLGAGRCGDREDGIRGPRLRRRTIYSQPHEPGVVGYCTTSLGHAATPQPFNYLSLLGLAFSSCSSSALWLSRCEVKPPRPRATPHPRRRPKGACPRCQDAAQWLNVGFAEPLVIRPLCRPRLCTRSPPL